MGARLLKTLALGAIGLVGCDGDSAGDVSVLQPVPATLSGIYSGQLPCSNCAAIVATLWLRDDGRFVLRQIPTDDPDAPSGTPSYALGRWRWDGEHAEAVLSGPGPDRRVLPIDNDRLRLQTVSSVEQVLSRDPEAPAFADRLRLDGESAVTKHGAVFTECRMGLRLPVTETGGYRELRRQHRVLNPRGKVTLTTIEGHFAVASSGDTKHEVLVIDRVMALKPGAPCPYRDH